jgi:DNA-binding MarR family transcriptional regulator
MQATHVTPEELAERLLNLWACMMRGGNQVYAVFEELDLSLTQIKTLAALDHLDAEPSVKSLSEFLGMSLAGTSRTVEQLLQRGWLERREDTADRRVKRLAITDAGRITLRKIDEARLAGMTDFTASLTDAQRDKLADAIADIPARPTASAEGSS